VILMAGPPAQPRRRGHESTTKRQEDVREVSRHTPTRSRAGDLSQPPPQAKAGLTWHVSPASTSPARSGWRSR
jgi:hypothetical protein